MLLTHFRRFYGVPAAPFRNINHIHKYNNYNPIFYHQKRNLHSQLASISQHLNRSLIRLAKEKFDSKMPDKLFDLLKDKLYLYYSIEEDLEKELSLEDRRRLSIDASKLGKFCYPFEQYCRKLIELKETSELLKLIEDESEKEAMKELETDLINQISKRELDMFSEIVKPSIDKNSSVILEIRSGVGGAEASLFVKDLTEMYQNFANLQNWDFEFMDIGYGEKGGYKEITAGISGGI